MRKLSPFKAVSHALNSVWTFRAAAFRIGMAWVPVMLIAGLVEYFGSAADPAAEPTLQEGLVQVVTALVSIIAVCSMAVSWHRYILRDELNGGLRLDTNVMRYAGNTVLIMLAMLVPAVMLVLAVMYLPALGAAGLPLALLFGGIVTRLSIKLPAVALGNAGFSFRDAWTASEGNFWACVGVFLLNAAILIGSVLVLTLVAGLFAQVSVAASLAFQLVVAVVMQVFYAIFNASIFTSLYGFFVERRDF